jgi:hypothetical protein
VSACALRLKSNRKSCISTLQDETCCVNCTRATRTRVNVRACTLLAHVSGARGICCQQQKLGYARKGGLACSLLFAV